MSSRSEATPGPSPPPPPWLGHVLDQAHLGFAVLDTGGRILWVNEATALVVGIAPGDFLSRDFSVLFPPAMAGQVPAILDRLREHGSLEIDVAKVGPDGERRSAHIRAEVISNADGSPRWILATLHDLRPQLDQLERMNASALTLLDAPGDDLLATIVRVARRLVGARYAALAVIEDGRLTRFSPDGLADEAIARIAHPPEGRGLLGAMIAERQTINVPVVAADPRSSGFPSGHPEMASFLGVPIIGGDVVYGHLYLADKEGAPAFGPVDEHVAELFAAHAAVAIRDSRQRRRLEASERRLAEAERIAQLGSWEWDPVTDALTWSDETYRIMGIEPGGVRRNERRVPRVRPSRRPRAGRRGGWSLPPEGSALLLHPPDHPARRRGPDRPRGSSSPSSPPRNWARAPASASPPCSAWSSSRAAGSTWKAPWDMAPRSGLAPRSGGAGIAAEVVPNSVEVRRWSAI